MFFLLSSDGIHSGGDGIQIADSVHSRLGYLLKVYPISQLISTSSPTENVPSPAEQDKILPWAGVGSRQVPAETKIELSVSVDEKCFFYYSEWDLYCFSG